MNEDKHTQQESDATVSSIVVLDVEGFSPRTNPIKGLIRVGLVGLVRDAALAVGLAWAEIGTNDTGDGMVLVFPPTVPPAVVAGPFIEALAERLALRRRFDAGDGADRIRLRASLNIGLVHTREKGLYGEALDFACRLVDAPPLRAVLAAAERSDLVFIVSDEVYHSVIRHNYQKIDSARFGPLRFDLKQLKDVGARVYAPGYPYPPGLPADPPSDAAARRRPPAPADLRDLPEPPQPPAGQFTNTAETVQGNQIGRQDVTVHTTGPVRF